VSPYVLRRFDGTSTTTLQIRMDNGPENLSDFYEIGHFADTVLYLSTSWGGLTYNAVEDCPVTIPGPVPPPDVVVNPPTDTPEPICEDYDVDFRGFYSNGVVRYRIRNYGYAPGQITGFNIDWNSLNKPYDDPLARVSLDYVQVGGDSAFDPAGVVIWDGEPDPDERPVVASSNADNPSPPTAGWQAIYVIEPGESVYIYLDFDGSNYLAHWQSGYAEWDFNNTYFVLNFDCYNQQEQVPTPGPTNTPTNTNTPRPPTETPTPGPPTKTPTPRPPTNTPTKTPNLPPTNTPTHTPTHTNTPRDGGDIGGE
jgi:hypothetical protein